MAGQNSRRVDAARKNVALSGVTGMTRIRPDVKPNRNTSRAVTLLVAGAFFMEMLDGTVITTALPQIGTTFGVSAVALNIGMTAYLLALAAFIPISGWVADRLGTRMVFSGAVALFTCASLLCGLSQNLWSFTAARLLQGIGGAAMVPVGRLIVLRMIEKEHLVKAMGTIVWPGLVAPVLGPPLGGFLVQYVSWPWIFFLNVPLGLLAIAIAVAIVPNDQPRGLRRPLDLIGFFLSSSALALIVCGVDALGNGYGRSVISLLLVEIGLILGGASVRHFRRFRTPLLDLSATRIPTFAVVVWGGSLLRVAIGSLPFLLPLLFQLGFGLDPLTSGGLVLFVFAGNLAMKLLTTRILRRFGFRTVMIANGIMVVLSIAACGLLTRETSYWLAAIILFAGGAFRSMQFTALATIQFADVPTDHLADTNTLASMLQQLTLGLGIVVGAGLLNMSAWLRGRVGTPPDPLDFRFAFFLAAVIAFVGLIDSVRLDRAAGRHVSGHGSNG